MWMVELSAMSDHRIYEAILSGPFLEIPSAELTLRFLLLDLRLAGFYVINGELEWRIQVRGFIIYKA